MTTLRATALSLQSPGVPFGPTGDYWWPQREKLRPAFEAALAAAQARIDDLRQRYDEDFSPEQRRLASQSIVVGHEKYMEWLNLLHAVDSLQGSEARRQIPAAALGSEEKAIRARLQRDHPELDYLGRLEIPGKVVPIRSGQ